MGMYSAGWPLWIRASSQWIRRFLGVSGLRAQAFESHPLALNEQRLIDVKLQSLMHPGRIGKGRGQHQDATGSRLVGASDVPRDVVEPDLTQRRALPLFHLRCRTLVAGVDIHRTACNLVRMNTITKTHVMSWRQCQRKL